MLKYRKNSSCVMSIKILMTAFFLPTNPASNIHIFRLTHIASFIKSDKSFVLSHKNSDLAGHVSFEERRNNAMRTRVISPVKALL